MRDPRDQRAEVSLTVESEPKLAPEPMASRAFRILVLGDFGAHGDGTPFVARAARRVDRDDLDAHLARLAPRLRFAVDDVPLDLAVASMDDFHPDRLAVRLEALGTTTSESRTNVAPRESAESSPAPSNQPPASTVDVARAVSGESLLEAMLGDAPEPSRDTPAAATKKVERLARHDELSAFVERAVAPHLVRSDPEVEARVAGAEAVLARRLRLVLHDPRVQSLEAAWRSLDFLVRRLDTDDELRLFMLDVPRDHAAAALEHIASERAAVGDESWALVVATHEMPGGERGAEMLAQIAMAARALGTPCIVGAAPDLAGRESAAALGDDASPSPPPEVFTLIRRSLEARFLGLTFPRVLLRVPYGHANPCDEIDFEELEDPERHEHYLWGSGAVLVALLAGESFLDRGWAIDGRIPRDVGSLPYFTYRRGPETVAASCAETIMSERIAGHLLSRGIMPVAWIRDTDSVRLVDLRSVADPPAPLAAAWATPARGGA